MSTDPTSEFADRRLREGESVSYGRMGYVIPIEFRIDWAYMHYDAYPPGTRYDIKNRLLVPCCLLTLQHQEQAHRVLRLLFEDIESYSLGLSPGYLDRFSITVTYYSDSYTGRDFIVSNMESSLFECKRYSELFLELGSEWTVR
ncbi:hypothetical protein IT575_08805 [bacterium]|nr:hypothetical protein [bacterium]